MFAMATIGRTNKTQKAMAEMARMCSVSIARTLETVKGKREGERCRVGTKTAMVGLDPLNYRAEV